MASKSPLLRIALVLCGLVTQASAADHWAFLPLERPPVPEVRIATWSPNPIDAFVLARLEAAHLEPSPQAPPHTLLRRLHLDLTGLLPSPGELSAFEEAWRRDPETAYAQKVAQLLDSPHFGEHWTRHWLDLARYADSDGYLGDDLRPWAWVYRDWVIDAINHDQPFDQFSIEQLAGDLLPEASQSQIVATGFHRNNLNNTEAGADRELNRTKQVVDRVATTGVTWLGLTLACAECHDHKHDPISQRDFYQLYAFFNNTDDADVPVRLEPEWREYEAMKQAWEAKRQRLEEPLAHFQGKPLPETEPTTRWTPLHPDKTTAAGVELTIQEDGSLLASGKTPSTVTFFVEIPMPEAVTITGFRLEAIGEFGAGREPGQSVGRGKDGQFVLSTFTADLVESGKPRRVTIASAKADHGDGQAIEKAIDSASNEGWRVATKTYQPHTAVFALPEPVVIPAGSRLKFSLGQKHGTGNSLRHFRISATADPGPFEPWAKPVDPKWAALRLALEKHLAAAPAPPATKGQALAERAPSDRRPSFIHLRGDYARPGDSVSPGTPAVLHSLKPGGNPDRLALARWLFDEANPLTARVAANQIWQHLFGEGIVATPDDFGTHGAPPSHPELLDWLATEFRRQGWSRKEFIRTLVLSSTYRQSSANTQPELPNTLLWRQNSFRVSAETVRDIHLFASGLFEPKVGGPGIYPPLPEFVREVGRTVQWPVSEGPDRYRRGMYISLKRTVLYPMLTAFDAPDTSVACSRRESTNTPMQALTLLNDPVFFECAEALGRDLHAVHGDNVKAAIGDLVRRCLNREPLPEEIATLVAAHRDFAQATPDPALAMIATARIVMNLDEFVTRD